MPQASPFDVAGFVAFWRACGAPKRILLAVSGGSDSMALLRIAANARGDAPFEIVAACVNHGLRESALAEVEQVGVWCRAIDVPFRQLDWEGQKPTTGIQAAARNMRYRLLVAEAIRENCQAIMTGHTQDDLAETVLMRLQRRSGSRGLASMTTRFAIASGPSVSIPLERPLLTARRDELRAYLKSVGQSYVDDPSNDDTANERIRARQSIQKGEADYYHGELVEMAYRAQKEKLLADQCEGARFEGLGGMLFQWGGASLKPSVLDLQSSTDIGVAARLIRAVGGDDHRRQDEDVFAALENALRSTSATLGGVLIRKRKDVLWFIREPAALMGRAGVAPIAPVALLPGKTIVWDQRFLIENLSDFPAVVAPWGQRDLDEAGSLPFEAVASLPSVEIEGFLPESPLDRRNCQFISLLSERFDGDTIRFQ